MPRNIPVGNGEMLVAFDDQYRMRDLYWPHVGMPNHTCGHLQRFGVWADGQFAWIDGEGWTRDLRYKPDTMVTEVRLRHERLGLEMLCNDVVDYWSPVFLRKIVVTDLFGRPRDVRIFLHHDISVNESPVGDTVHFDPQSGGLVHYKEATILSDEVAIIEGNPALADALAKLNETAPSSAPSADLGSGFGWLLAALGLAGAAIFIVPTLRGG